MSRTVRALLVAGLAAFTATALPARAETVGEVGVDWLGNDIMIDAVTDPKIKGADEEKLKAAIADFAKTFA